MASHTPPAASPGRPWRARRTARRALEQWIAREPLRFHMAILIALAGSVGFVASIGLLAAGLAPMWLRYPLAAALAYGTFLLALGVWLRRLRARFADGRRPRSFFVDGIVDALLSVPTPDLGRSAAAPRDFAFSGGEFGGGGAGGSFDAAVGETTSAVPQVIGRSATRGGRLLEFLDLDDAWPLVVALALAGALIIVAGYLVWIAPVLLGELLFDGLLAGAAYKRVRDLEPDAWHGGALRRTWIPATCLIVSLTVVGAAATWVRTDADSIGDLFVDSTRP